MRPPGIVYPSGNKKGPPKRRAFVARNSQLNLRCFSNLNHYAGACRDEQALLRLKIGENKAEHCSASIAGAPANPTDGEL
jgi:hypothetical protein